MEKYTYDEQIHMQCEAIKRKSQNVLRFYCDDCGDLIGQTGYCDSCELRHAEVFGYAR